MPLKLLSPKAPFAPFFLAAILMAIAAIAAWGLVYFLAWPLPLTTISSFQWHAHEMLYGYVMAVIAGFLLTAVMDWTGQPAGKGWTLIALLLMWLAARLLLAAGLIAFAAVFDLIFVAWLAVIITLPIVRSRQWRQMAVVSKLMLLGVGNLSFYLGAMGVLERGAYWGIYGGLYLVLSLILTVGRRLLPDFIEAAQHSDKRLFNSRWLDVSSLSLFLAFFVSELVATRPVFSAYCAMGVAVINGVRLLAWHRPVIWTSSLLWSLYLSLWLIVLGFFLFGLSYWLGWSPFIAIHAMAIGGIALVTMSMMARLALDARGGSESPMLAMALVLVLVAMLFRVLLALLWPEHYRLWVFFSLLAWLAAFVLFSMFYLRTLMARPVVQGH